MLDKMIQEQYEELRTLFKQPKFFQLPEIENCTIIVSPDNHCVIDRKSETFRTLFILDRFADSICYVEEDSTDSYDWNQNNIRIPGGKTAKGWTIKYNQKIALWIEKLDGLIKSRNKIIGEE